MPRTVFDKKRDKLYVLLNGSTADLSRDELGAIIGRCPRTARERMRRPETLTLEELFKICRKQHIPIEELRQAITY